MRYEGLPGQADGRIYTVTDIAEGVAVLDNHPLAGYALRFDLTVRGIERASEGELAVADRPQPPEFLRVVERQIIRPSLWVWSVPCH